MIKHKPGDILEPSGCIFIEVGKVVTSGVVIIHRSRLKRAKRFGWIEVDDTIGIRLDKPVVSSTSSRCVVLDRSRRSCHRSRP